MQKILVIIAYGAYALAAGVLILSVCVALAEEISYKGLIPIAAGCFGIAFFGVLIHSLSEILRHLENISNQLTWLMPEDGDPVRKKNH